MWKNERAKVNDFLNIVFFKYHFITEIFNVLFACNESSLLQRMNNDRRCQYENLKEEKRKNNNNIIIIITQI